MIKCKITKRIMSDTPTLAGIPITVSQIVTAIIAVLLGLGTVLLLKDVLDLNLTLWIVFLELLVCVLCGIVKIQGQSLLIFLFKSPISIRPYNSKGDFDEPD